MSDSELEKKFAAVSRVVRMLMLQIMKDRAEHLALVTHLRYSGLIDTAKLADARREVDGYLRAIFDNLENVDEPEMDRMVEMLLKFEGPVQ